MSRQRAPAAPRSPYITREGFNALVAELEGLWQRRREVTAALTAAAAEGDRSENAEYIYRKKELRELDRRIRYLQKRLPELKPVDSRPSDPERIFFGAWISLEDESGAELNCRIVGADEFDPKRGWISIDSPIARALLQRRADDQIRVQTPAGPKQYLVLEVRYD
jgi:transcription elongation factor GreB